jgi:N-acetyl-D-muramate 6-phosphate phosphatase
MTRTCSPVSFQLTDSCVLFDLDGTLLDTAADFEKVLLSLCHDEGVEAPDSGAVHATVSSGARALLKLAFDDDAADARFESLLQLMLNRYELQIENTLSALYPGMENLLQTLETQAIPWGVVTNKPVRFSLPLMKALTLDSRCSVLICPDDVTNAKPHPEPLLLACDRLSRMPDASVYVGDHPRDIIAGKAAGMKTIAAAYGYLPEYPPVSDWGADLIVNSVQQISHTFWPSAQNLR